MRNHSISKNPMNQLKYFEDENSQKESFVCEYKAKQKVDLMP
jgi:hypothetical protein